MKRTSQNHRLPPEDIRIRRSIRERVSGRPVTGLSSYCPREDTIPGATAVKTPCVPTVRKSTSKVRHRPASIKTHDSLQNGRVD